MLPTFSELFPTELRANWQGFCLGGGRGFGSVIPALVGILSARMSFGTALGACALCAYAVALSAAALLLDTFGRNLQDGGADRRTKRPIPAGPLSGAAAPQLRRTGRLSDLP